MEETRVVSAELSTFAVAIEAEPGPPPLVLMRAVMVRVQVPCLEGASRKAPETATEAGEEGRKEMLYEGGESVGEEGRRADGVNMRL